MRTLFRQLLHHILAGHRLFLAPIVIRVAFEAARFRCVRTSAMALLAGLDARDKYVGSLAAAVGLSVTRRALHHLVRFMIEFSVWQPARGDGRLGDRGKIANSVRITQAMAFLAGFSPQQQLRVRHALLHPLARRFARAAAEDASAIACRARPPTGSPRDAPRCNRSIY